jgi:multidrug efflux pump subunit AcrB
LNHRFLTIAIAVVLLGISMYFFNFVNKSFFPKAEQPNMMIRISLPEGSNIDKTDKVAHYVESVLDTIPEVKYYATNVGHGNPRIYYNVWSRNYTAHFAEIYVELNEYDPFEFGNLIDRLRNTFKGYPGAKINIKEFEQGPPVEAPIQIFITGKELNKLSAISMEFETFLKKQVGAINIENEFSKNKNRLVF